ncbi:MAG: hypothetical protein WBE38_17120 [Terracidiphilus sp.]
MQTAADNPDLSSSFAGALAAFASETADHSIDPGGDPGGDGLADDVAVLSYEGAVRAQTGRVQTGLPFADPYTDSPGTAAAATDGPSSSAMERETAASGSNLKAASITIRMSQAECAQLRKRAAAAGLTVSAYLRSCTFEAEALRAQVKEALAELRAATPDETRTVTHAPRRWWRPWPHAGSRSAQA